MDRYHCCMCMCHVSAQGHYNNAVSFTYALGWVVSGLNTYIVTNTCHYNYNTRHNSEIQCSESLI